MSKQNGRGWFIPAGAALGLILAWALAKMLWVIGTLGYPLSNGGAAVLFRLEPGEYSFFGGVMGFVLGFWLLAKPAGLARQASPIPPVAPAPSAIRSTFSTLAS